MRSKPLIGLNADYRPAKKDSPASYNAAKAALASRDARYDAAHIPCRIRM